MTRSGPASRADNPIQREDDPGDDPTQDTACVTGHHRGPEIAEVPAHPCELSRKRFKNALHYERAGNLEEVARRTGLDRRTVKRYLSLPAATIS